MRRIKKYKKIEGTKAQKKKLEILNKFQDDISKSFFDKKLKNKNSY